MKVLTLNEYAESDKCSIELLKKYLTQTESEKIHNLHLKYPQAKQIFKNNILNKDISYPFDLQWDTWLYSIIVNETYWEYNIEDVELPLWAVMEYKRSLKSEYLVHFSNNALKIVKEKKFKNCVWNYDSLAFTGDAPAKYKGDIGFVFSYLLENYQYGMPNWNDFTDWPFGNQMVLFKASGLEVYHKFDENLQIISCNTSITNYHLIIPTLINTSDEIWNYDLVNANTNKVINSDTDLLKLVKNIK